jgi:hypothetical protein
MLIAAIVIGITYTAYSMISRSYLSFKEKNDRIAVLNRVDQLLKRDFERAEVISGSGNTVLIRNDSAPVRYEFTPKAVIRTSGLIDTFKVNTADVRLAFEGKTMTDATEQMIDELAFSVSETIPYHYHKTYSSFNLIKTNPDADH